MVGKKFLGLEDIYPKSATVLLWIGTAVVTIIAACWVLVQTHVHTEYVSARELALTIENNNAKQLLSQNKIISTLNTEFMKLTDTVREQSKIIGEIKYDMMIRDKMRKNVMRQVLPSNDNRRKFNR